MGRRVVGRGDGNVEVKISTPGTVTDQGLQRTRVVKLTTGCETIRLNVLPRQVQLRSHAAIVRSTKA